MEDINQKAEKPLKLNKQRIVIGLLAITLVLTLYNQFQIISLSSSGITPITGLSTVSASDVIPKGSPKIYGSELGIKYDDVTPDNPGLADQTIETLAKIDSTTQLEGDQLTRYIKIVSQISCEYCCGAKSIIFSDGKPACGCAHSFAMRGLAKYLISKHGTEFSDDEILSELAKWKALFFPGQMQAKAQALKDNGIEVNYINLGSNKYRGIEKGALQGSGMVGGC